MIEADIADMKKSTDCDCNSDQQEDMGPKPAGVHCRSSLFEMDTDWSMAVSPGSHSYLTLMTGDMVEVEEADMSVGLAMVETELSTEKIGVPGTVDRRSYQMTDNY